MKARTLFLLTAAILLVALLAPAARAQAPGNPPIHAAHAIPFRPVNADYWQIKAALDANAPRGGRQLSSTGPTLGPSWPGVASTCNCSPSDSNGAIGPTEYIEVINENIGVYNRSGVLQSSNTEAGWTSNSTSYGDGVIEYSAPDSRFYATLLSISGSNYQLLFGFSKTNAPSANNADWCFYQSNFGGRYGANLPDYPKLGDTADFILIGVNTFQNGQTYIGSDVAWVSKPPAGTITTCPALSSFTLGVQTALKNADGTLAGTPNPAKKTDSNSTGYVVADKDPGRRTSSVLSLYTVTKNNSGGATFSPATTVSVGAFAYPPSAPQQGTNKKLDTLDARLMSAWAAPDPSHGGAVAVWTGHTVKASAGGTGAEFRWYEINPATGALFQSGKVQSSSLYVFMGAISPDRNGAAHAFGSNAVMAFNTSSKSALPAAAMASVVGGLQSGIVTVLTSPAPDKDFSCTPVCRWGDYSGASPDPASGTSGQVWATVMTNGSSGNPSWTTENWAATP
jgi:hypothetical protein